MVTKEQLELREKWCLALESGAYKQSAGTLHDRDEEEEDGFCCLGVICDLIEPAWKEYEWDSSDINYKTFYWKDTPNLIFLPEEVCETLGFITNNPITSNGSLAHMNDCNLPFTVIAEAIRKGGPNWDGTRETYGVTNDHIS